MHLYHHPLSLDSQKVRMALEEMGIDYTSHHVNPVTGKNLDYQFFSSNRRGEIPVFSNGARIILDTVEIIKYIEKIAAVSHGVEEKSFGNPDVEYWMNKVQAWDPTYFTLHHIPEKYRTKVFCFLRRVAMARMVKAPDLASAYSVKLKEIYQIMERSKVPEVYTRSSLELVQLLNEAEMVLNEKPFLAGTEFSLADVMLIPVLARLDALDLEEEHILKRPSLMQYWKTVQQRPSYKVVIGRFFVGWKKYKTLFRTWFYFNLRCLVRKY